MNTDGASPLLPLREKIRSKFMARGVLEVKLSQRQAVPGGEDGAISIHPLQVCACIREQQKEERNQDARRMDLSFLVSRFQ
jgi:hypothetical protein